MAHFRLEVVTGNRKTVVAEEHPWSSVRIDSRVKELLRNTKWNASHPFLPANCPLREYHWHTQMGRLTPLAADCATDSLFWLTSECNKCLCNRKIYFSVDSFIYCSSIGLNKPKYRLRVCSLSCAMSRDLWSIPHCYTSLYSLPNFQIFLPSLAFHLDLPKLPSLRLQ